MYRHTDVGGSMHTIGFHRMVGAYGADDISSGRWQAPNIMRK